MLIRFIKPVLAAGFVLGLATFITAANDPAPSLKLNKRLMDESKYSRDRGGAEVDTIMLHFCSDVAENPTAPYSLDRIVGIFEKYGVSAHYLIDRQGTVHQLVREERAAFHAGRGHLPWQPHRANSLNNHSIGIEMMAIGSKEEMTKFISAETYEKVPPGDIGFTEVQYFALIPLIKEIEGRWPGIKHDRQHVVGHDTYAPDRRSDPGRLFDWSRLNLLPLGGETDRPSPPAPEKEPAP